MHRAQNAIAADPTLDWTLAQLGRVVEASPRNLSRLFSLHAGMTVNDTIGRGRIALARDLVEQTDLSIDR